MWYIVWWYWWSNAFPMQQNKYSYKKKDKEECEWTVGKIWRYEKFKNQNQTTPSFWFFFWYFDTTLGFWQITESSQNWPRWLRRCYSVLWNFRLFCIKNHPPAFSFPILIFECKSLGIKIFRSLVRAPAG